MAPGQGPL